MEQDSIATLRRQIEGRFAGKSEVETLVIFLGATDNDRGQAGSFLSPQAAFDPKRPFIRIMGETGCRTPLIERQLPWVTSAKLWRQLSLRSPWPSPARRPPWRTMMAASAWSPRTCTWGARTQRWPPRKRRSNCLPRSRRSTRSEEHTSELQSRENLVCRLLLEKK